MAAVSTLLLTSCGSYQYTGTSNDGVYGDNDAVEYGERDYGNREREENGDYYKKMFEEEAALYGEVLAEDAIFTDVDTYSSTGNYENDNQNSNYQGGNAPWGNSPDSYSINIYNDGFYGGYSSYGRRGYYAYDPFWGPGNYYGPFYGSGFYSPYGYGFGYGNGYGYGHGYGYGIGFSVHPFFYGGGGYYNPYNHYSYRQHNFRQNVAYNYGRRGANSYNTNRASAVRNATSLENRGRSSTYSRSIRNIRNSNDEYGITRRTTSTRAYNTRSNSDGSYSRSRSSTRAYNTRSNSDGSYSRSRSSTSTNSPVRRSNSTATRSNNSSNRSSSSTVRSSNSGRSSSSGRSSGTSTRDNRGRGN